jgi:hypothetical protein
MTIPKHSSDCSLHGNIPPVNSKGKGKWRGMGEWQNYFFAALTAIHHIENLETTDIHFFEINLRTALKISRR